MPTRSLGKLHMLKLPLTSCLSHLQITLLMHRATTMKESGAWVHALPMSSLGLRMDDNVCVATGLHLGVTLCRQYLCQQCGVAVDYLGTHGLSCRKSQGHFSRHAEINDNKEVICGSQDSFSPRTIRVKSI